MTGSQPSRAAFAGSRRATFTVSGLTRVGMLETQARAAGVGLTVGYSETRSRCSNHRGWRNHSGGKGSYRPLNGPNHWSAHAGTRVRRVGQHARPADPVAVRSPAAQVTVLGRETGTMSRCRLWCARSLLSLTALGPHGHECPGGDHQPEDCSGEDEGCHGRGCAGDAEQGGRGGGRRSRRRTRRRRRRRGGGP